LELSKKGIGQKKDKQLPQVSFDENFKMNMEEILLYFVKWIFLISIIEFALPHLLSFCLIVKVWLFGRFRLGNFLIVFECRAIFPVVLFFSSFNFTKIQGNIFIGTEL